MEAVGAVTGNHIWADRYDRKLADVFALQDEITKKDAAAIEPKLLECKAMRTQSCWLRILAPSDTGSRMEIHVLPTYSRVAGLFFKLFPVQNAKNPWNEKS